MSSASLTSRHLPRPAPPSGAITPAYVLLALSLLGGIGSSGCRAERQVMTQCLAEDFGGCACTTSETDLSDPADQPVSTCDRTVADEQSATRCCLAGPDSMGSGIHYCYCGGLYEGCESDEIEVTDCRQASAVAAALGTSSSCVPGGGACDLPSSTCCDGSYCANNGEFAATGTCTPSLEDGASCTSGAQCKSSNCIAGTCMAYCGYEGDACVYPNDCCNGNCQGGTCGASTVVTPPPGGGSDGGPGACVDQPYTHCSSAADCCSGYCDVISDQSSDTYCTLPCTVDSDCASSSTWNGSGGCNLHGSYGTATCLP
jgi:hypothetical protein